MESPVSFSERISRHSERNGRHHLFPGDDYATLAGFFGRSSRATGCIDPRNDESNPFVVIHNLDMSGQPLAYQHSGHGASTSGQDSDQSPHSPSAKTQRSPSLVFLRGYASPDWLSRIGTTYHVDPAFYQRHLHFRTLGSAARNLYSNPGLLSSTTDIIQLRISTIRSDDTATLAGFPESLEDARRQAAEGLRKYHQGLETHARVCDSVVRQYTKLSRKFSIIEQFISISVHQQGDSWNAVIWTDIGRDLSASVPGPWTPPAGSPAWTTYLYPVIQHRRYLALCEQAGQVNTMDSPARDWQAGQNASFLPFQYGQFLNKDIRPFDVLYALHDVFRLSAAAEVQYLNLIKELYEHELEVARKSFTHTSSVLNLQHFKKSVDDHIEKLSEIAAWLKDRRQLDWPRLSPGTTHFEEAERAASLIQNDFMLLKQRAERLSKSCQGGVESLVQLAAFQESVKAVENAERVEKLTKLATIFLPLGFTCSFFGMNFSEFGQGPLSLWVYFATTVFFLLMLYFSWRFWDVVRYSKNLLHTKRLS